MLRAALVRIRAVRMLAEIDHPERHGVANIAALVLKLGDVDGVVGVARAVVELGHLNILLRNGVAEWRCDILNTEDGLLNRCDGLLVSESVIVTVEQDRAFKFIVGHGGEI